MITKILGFEKNIKGSFARVRLDISRVFSWTQYNSSRIASLEKENKKLVKAIFALDKEISKLKSKPVKPARAKKFISSETASKIHSKDSHHVKQIKNPVLYDSVEDAIIDGKKVCSCAV